MNVQSAALVPVLPHSIEAEQQFLGALMVNNDLVHKIGGVVKGDDFFDPVHQRMFKNIIDRVSHDQLASVITVQTDFASDEGLKELGGGRYLARLAGSASQYAVVEYAKLIAELHKRRELLELADGIKARIAADETASTTSAELEIFLHTQEPDSEPRSMSLLKSSASLLQNIIDIRDGKITAVPSGLPDLDESLRLARKRYTILGGTTSMGKTALALWIAHQGAKGGYGVGIVSLEMPEDDLTARINSIDSKVPYKAMERPMSNNTLRMVAEAAKTQESLPIEIFSARVGDLPAILSEAKKLKHKWTPNGNFKGLGLLVIDYIQLVKGKGNQFEVLSSVANELKQVAKLLDVHVLALAQIDRKLIEADNPRPQLSHLRGSGDLENAPDNVIFCFREEYFLERTPKPKDVEELNDHYAALEASRNTMEIIIGKARMGEIGTVKVGCDMATNRFWGLQTTQDMGF